MERFEKIAKPQDAGQSTVACPLKGDKLTPEAGDSTSTGATTGSGSGSGGDSNGSDKSSAGANGIGESGSGGSEEGSDKGRDSLLRAAACSGGNGFSADGSQQKAEVLKRTELILVHPAQFLQFLPSKPHLFSFHFAGWKL